MVEPLQRPVVSVATPVYNGAQWLSACIESVLSQTHTWIDYVILDNNSSDGSREIAETYAARDGRIRVHANPTTIPMCDNWNRALELTSPESAYCWLLPADDLMYPSAVEKMVDVAERHPTVGVVGSLRDRGGLGIQCTGLRTDQEVFPGTLVARGFLDASLFVIAPTTNLIRADLVRSRRPFFPKAYFHEDIAAFIDILRHCDFGFVHEVLSCSRAHEGSVTATVVEPQQTILRDTLGLLIEFGPDLFGPAQLERAKRRHLDLYYRWVMRSYFEPSSRPFREMHLDYLRGLGLAPGGLTLVASAVQQGIGMVGNPRRLLDRLRRKYAARY